jgi:hypothetical protein
MLVLVLRVANRDPEELRRKRDTMTGFQPNEEEGVSRLQEHGVVNLDTRSEQGRAVGHLDNSVNSFPTRLPLPACLFM